MNTYISKLADTLMAVGAETPGGGPGLADGVSSAFEDGGIFVGLGHGVTVLGAAMAAAALLRVFFIFDKNVQISDGSGVEPVLRGVALAPHEEGEHDDHHPDDACNRPQTETRLLDLFIEERAARTPLRTNLPFFRALERAEREADRIAI